MESTSLRSSLWLPEEWQRGVYIVYDGDCPFCSNFVKYQKLQYALGKIKLVNAREKPDVVDRFASAGMPLDNGMALVMDGQTFYGAECLNRLALLSSKSDLFNKLNAAIFRSPAVSSALYPLLKFGRRITLTVLGVGRLR